MGADAAPPTAEELAAIRARHRPAETEGRFAYQGCYSCGQGWPCDAARVLAAVDRRDDLLAHARAMADELFVARRVVEAARALDLAGVGGAARALREALAAYDAAAKGEA